MNPVMKTYPVRELQRDYRAVVDAAKASRDAVLLVRNSKPEAVVLDVETYNALVEDTYPMDEPYTYKLVQQALASVKKGKLKQLKRIEDLDRP